MLHISFVVRYSGEGKAIDGPKRENPEDREKRLYFSRNRSGYGNQSIVFYAEFLMDEHKSAYENMKEMTGAERFRYFREYYLVRTLVILAAAGLIFHLVWHYTHLPGECVFYGFVFNDMYETDGKARTVDTFEKLAGEGTFADLTEALDEQIYTELEEQLVYCAGYEEQDLSYAEDPFREAGNGAGEVLPYGIVISEGERYRAISMTGDEFLCGIVANSRHTDNAEAAIAYFMSTGE